LLSQEFLSELYIKKGFYHAAIISHDVKCRLRVCDKKRSHAKILYCSHPMWERQMNSVGIISHRINDKLTALQRTAKLRRGLVNIFPGVIILLARKHWRNARGWTRGRFYGPHIVTIMTIDLVNRFVDCTVILTVGYSITMEMRLPSRGEDASVAFCCVRIILLEDPSMHPSV